MNSANNKNSGVLPIYIKHISKHFLLGITWPIVSHFKEEVLG